MAYDVPLRENLEKAGYEVKWQGQGKPIRITGKDVAGNPVTYDILPGAYELKGGKAYIDPNTTVDLLRKAGYEWVRQAVPYREAGNEFSYDPKTNTVEVKSKSGYGTYTFMSPIVVGGKAYVSPTEASQAARILGGPVTAASQDIMADVSSYKKEVESLAQQQKAAQEQALSEYTRQINDYIKQWGDAAMAMLKVYQENYNKALEQLQKLMQPDPTVPETVKVAISMLRKNLEENLKELGEEMNRRGIYQSGLAAEMERRMREGALTEEQKLLAQWIDEAHKRAYDAAMQYADYLAKFASEYANLYGTAMTKPIEMAMNLAKDVYQGRSNILSSYYGALQEGAKNALDMAARLRQWAAEQQQNWYNALLQRQWQLEDERRKRQWQLEDWEREAQLQRELWGLRTQTQKDSDFSTTYPQWAQTLGQLLEK